MKITLHKNPPLTPCKVEGLNHGDYMWCSVPGTVPSWGKLSQFNVPAEPGYDNQMMDWEKAQLVVVNNAKAGDEVHVIDWDDGNISVAKANQVLIPEIHVIKSDDLEEKYEDLLNGLVKYLWLSKSNDGRTIHNLKKLLAKHRPHIIDWDKPIELVIAGTKPGVPTITARVLRYLWGNENGSVCVYKLPNGEPEVIRVPHGTNVVINNQNKLMPNATVRNSEDAE